MNEELKSCPFCGEKAEIQIHPAPTLVSEKYFYTVWCVHCCSTTDIFSTKESAIEFWNHRAVIRPAEKAELDEDAIGFTVYRYLTGYGPEMAKESWTARHTAKESRKIEASEIAKAICDQFRPASADKLAEALEGLIEYLEAMGDDGHRAYKQAKQALAEYEKEQVKP